MKARFLLPLLLLLALSGIVTRRAQAEGETPGITLTVSAGLDGQCRQDAWMPVWVTVQNDSLPLGEVQIRITLGENIYQLSTDLPPHSRKSFETYVYTPWNPRLTARLVSEGEVLAQATSTATCGSPDDLYVGVWSGDVNTAATLPPLTSSGGGLRRAFLSGSMMPTQSIGLDAFDVLVIGADSDTRTLSEAQRQAIRLWTLSGGRVLVFGGGNWAYALGLDEMLPFQPQGSRLASLPDMDTPLTLATGILRREADILYGDEQTPLLLTRPLGSGWVTYTTFDPRAIPVERAWEILSPLWPAGERASSTHLLAPGANDDGYTALHILPSQPRFTLLLLCLISGVYLLAVGPLNFYLLRRRKEWIWGSSLAIAGVFTLGVLTLGGFLHGQPLVNQLVIVQSWPESDTARVDGLLGIYSPRRGTHTYQADSDLWAFPLESYGPFTDRYPRPLVEHTDNVLRFPDTRMKSNSMTHAGISSTRDAPRYTADLSMQRAAQELQLEGSLAWNEDFPLQDAVLIWGDRWIALGDIQSGSNTDLYLSTGTGNRSSDLARQILQGDWHPSYGSSPPRQKQQSAMLSALLGDTVPLEGNRAIVAGWSDALHGLPLTWKQDGRPLKTEGQTLYLLSLPIRQEDVRGEAFSYRYTVAESSYSTYLYPSDEQTIKTQLPFDVPPGMRLASLSVHLKTDVQPSPLDVSLWNYTTRQYDPFIFQDGGIYLPQGNPQDYFSAYNTCRLYIRLPEQADYLHIEDIELEVEFAPSP